MEFQPGDKHSWQNSRWEDPQRKAYIYLILFYKGQQRFLP